MKVRIADVYMFLTIFLLTLSHCVAFVGTKIEHITEYSGYFLLLVGVLVSYFNLDVKYRKKNTTAVVIILSALMIPGILIQNLSFMRKVNIILTILAIIMVSIMSENYIKDARIFRTMAYSCMFGVLVSTVICFYKGVPLIKPASEATFGISNFFNGGIRDKNIATMMILVIISLYIYNKELGKKKTIDVFASIVALVLIVTSSSRGAWIELLVFVLMLNYKLIRFIKKEQRIGVIILALILIIPIGLFFYNNYILKSETFLFRHRGLLNYISMFKDDKVHFILGNAELAYGSGIDYAIAIRSVTGWDGTIENSWLNILIKSGVLGVIGYLIIFLRAIITAIKCKRLDYSTIYLSVTMSLFISSFVAIYIQTIHGLFGIYCYLIMAYYSWKIRSNQDHILI